MRTVTPGSHFGASDKDSRPTQKSSQNPMPFWSPIWLHLGLLSGALSASKSGSKSKQKSVRFPTQFLVHFGSQKASKMEVKIRAWSLKADPEILTRPFGHLPWPQRLRPGPRGSSSYRFLDCFWVVLAPLQGLKMEPLGVVWERFFIGLRSLFHAFTVAPVHDRAFASS